MTHLHWVIWAYEQQMKGQFIGMTTLDVIAPDVNAAIVLARQRVPGKAGYWVNNCVEHHDDHGSEQ